MHRIRRLSARFLPVVALAGSLVAATPAAEAAPDPCGYFTTGDFLNRKPYYRHCGSGSIMVEIQTRAGSWPVVCLGPGTHSLQPWNRRTAYFASHTGESC